MVKTKIKRAVSFVMATVLSLSAFMSIGTSTAFAASGEKTKVYMVDFPRDGDANYDGVWGHSKQFLENDNPVVLLPHFSCHSLRRTFTTRMCEAGVNVKVIQDALGHKDVSTTLNIYTDVTKELRKSEFEGLELQFNQ